MQVLLVFFAALAGFALASFLAIYAYGLFAKRVQGAPSHALAVADDGTELDRLVAPLLAAHPEESGLALLADNVDAFAVRALTARRAGRSLDVQLYMWRNDLTGRLMINEVVQAADRGVRVRLLLDDLNARGHDRFLLALDRHPNIEIRLFNPSVVREGPVRRAVELMLRAVAINRRMHNKSWIADGRIAIVGGRNIGDAYFDADRAANFRDLDVVMLGPVVRQTEEVFDRFWNSRAAIPIAKLWRVRVARLPRVRRRLAAAIGRADAGARPYLQRAAEQRTLDDMLRESGGMHWTAKARVVSDPPKKVIGDGEAEWLMRAVRPLLTQAKQEVEIISPYFIPGEAGAIELSAMASRGVKVAVLTNSLAATDVAAVHGAYAHYRVPLLKAGIALFELKPYDLRSRHSMFGSSGASLHTKSFMVDGRMGFIGSMNFDPRSASLNSEMGVFFEHPDLVAEMRAIFADETSPKKAYRLALEDGRIVWRDGGNTERHLHDEPGAPLGRRIAAIAIGWLPLQSQL